MSQTETSPNQELRIVCITFCSLRSRCISGPICIAAAQRGRAAVIAPLIGDIALDGFVGNQIGKTMAAMAARYIPGAFSVTGNLIVDQSSLSGGNVIMPAGFGNKGTQDREGKRISWTREGEPLCPHGKSSTINLN
jgi:hypothetical protein